MRKLKGRTLIGLQHKLGKWTITVILSLYSAIVAAYPVFYTVLNSLKTRLSYAKNRFGFPTSPTLENYADVFSRFNFFRLLFNSFITTLGGVALCTVVAFLAAYAVTKMRIRGSSFIFLLIVATLMIPNQTIMCPLYQTALDMKLVGQYYGLILVYAAFGLPLGTFLIAAYFRGIPDEILEAARIDGANHIQILTRVMFPISIPAVATLAIINMVWMWNDLLLPLLILSQEQRTTLMVAISLIRTQYDVHVPLISAGLAIGMLPVIVTYLLFQRQLVKGMTAGAVKS